MVIFMNKYFSKFQCGFRKGNSITAGNYVFKVNNRNTKARSDICSKLTIKAPHGAFIVNFEHISRLALVFLSNFKQVNSDWDHVSQLWLATLIENWTSAVSRRKSFGAFLNDLSKAFDSLAHKLLLAISNAYDFCLSGTSFSYSQLPIQSTTKNEK